MHAPLRRLTALAAAGALFVAAAGTVAAASPEKLTAVVAVDSTAAPAAGQAWVRVLHGSPDAPAVDIYLDGAKVGAPLAGLTFGQISDYVPVPAGDHAIKVCASADATVCPIDVPSINLADGSKYTIAATDLLANIQAQVLTDAPAANAEQTQVRVVHFSADTPAVDVLTQDGTTKVVDDLAYPNATAYLALAAGSYDLKVCAHSDNTVCPLDPAALQLDAGEAYSVFAVGSLSATLATAAPAITPPATDVVAPAEGTSGNGLGLALVVLAIAAIVGVAASLPLATRRTRR